MAISYWLSAISGNTNLKHTLTLNKNNMEIKNLKPAGMEIKVLGTGCAKCKSLEKVTREAVAEAGINATVTKVEDIVEIMNYGIMTTPALVINDKVVVKGRVSSKDEIKKLINV